MISLARFAVCVILGFSLPAAWAAELSPAYFPPAGSWAERTPEQTGADSKRLQEAIAFSQANENQGPKDLALDLKENFSKTEPLWRLLGPTQTRGGMTGIVIHRGYVIKTWGEPARVDMTHSVTKTFLTTVIGLAWQKQLIRDLNAPAKSDLPPGAAWLFASSHNSPITWDHLLRQTSDWSGTLWDIPDWADRPVGQTPADHPNRPMHAPGSYYKYNDVRMNVLALAGLHIWRKPLPEVLRDELMDPIGASDTWRWHGYENSWVEIDGKRMQSVTGGGHFGGGMFINAWDMARFGYLFLRNGEWNDRKIVSPEWIRLGRTPGAVNPGYGFANWFLNQDKKMLPTAPASSFVFRGNGSNVIYIDQENDLLVVVRWIETDKIPEFIDRVLTSLNEPVRK